jgi:hypothetical protein
MEAIADISYMHELIPHFEKVRDKEIFMAKYIFVTGGVISSLGKGNNLRFNR